MVLRPAGPASLGGHVSNDVREATARPRRKCRSSFWLSDSRHPLIEEEAFMRFVFLWSLGACAVAIGVACSGDDVTQPGGNTTSGNGGTSPGMTQGTTSNTGTT